MAEKKKQHGENAPTSVQLAIDFQFPEGLVGRYANHAVVQLGEHDCHISFFEIQPPLILGTPEQMQEQVKSLKTVPAKCIARIVLAKELVPSIIKAMQESWDKDRAARQTSNGKKRDE